MRRDFTTVFANWIGNTKEKLFTKQYHKRTYGFNSRLRKKKSAAAR